MTSPLSLMKTSSRRRPLASALIVLAVTLGLVAGGVPPMAEAATKSLTLKANSSVWAKVGPKRLTSIAQVAVVAPTTAVEFGLQFRASAKSSGYRAKVKIAANGTVTGSFSRVKSYKQSAIGSARSLGLTAQPGDSIHLEATVVAKKTVRLYLRAWKEGTAKPSAWQMTTKDSSSKRIAKAGSTYLWARTPAGSPKVSLSYGVVSVRPFSAAKAAAIGVETSPPASPANTFSIAVIGDTQSETSSDTDSRFGDRTAWLAANKGALKLTYALHTGDVVNWGWLVPKQYTNARRAMAKLTEAKVPWSIAVGNHDTRVVGWNNIAGSTGYGGSAYAQNPECATRLSPAACKSSLLVRSTTEFNDSFPARNLLNLGGTFEAGKIDNAWTTFTVSDTKWLVLNLEFAPRRTAVEWARKVVAGHPKHNVIIDTHFYLNGKGSVSGSNAGYGETSGKYIYDQIVSKYSNVKIVVSGHTGSFASRTDTNKGNKTLSYLGNDLGESNNPVRILTINTLSGKVTNTVYSKVKPGSAKQFSTGSAKISVIR